jgi:hypothetical protein
MHFLVKKGSQNANTFLHENRSSVQTMIAG